MQEYRFHSGKISSAQVTGLPVQHLVNTRITKELNYVEETDQHRFFHLVYILDEMDRRFVQELDEQYLFSTLTQVVGFFNKTFTVIFNIPNSFTDDIFLDPII